MTTPIDFLQWLAVDVSLKILKYLDDPSDLICASSVSRVWRNFVIANELSKQLCLRIFPQLATASHIIEPNCKSDVPSGYSIEWGIRERDHRVYATLFRALKSFPVSNCIAGAISASSTDRYPEESVVNTLDPRDRGFHGALYWSSRGSRDPEVSESLIYQLSASLCVITEIDIKPFQEYLQYGGAIFSSKVVRFRMGHPKCASIVGRSFLETQECADDKFIWTYVSQEFTMAQENRLQRFKLQEPAICFGGYLQVEFLGMVQTHQMDGRFYVCVSHVQAIGRSLSPAFTVAIAEPSTLTYDADGFNRILRCLSDGSFRANLHLLSAEDGFLGDNTRGFNPAVDRFENEPQSVDEAYSAWWQESDEEE